MLSVVLVAALVSWSVALLMAFVLRLWLFAGLPSTACWLFNSYYDSREK